MTEILKGLRENEEESEWERRDGVDRRSIGWKQIVDNKIVAGLVLALVLWFSAKVSGLSSLPDAVAQHGTRLSNVELEMRALREAQIRQDEAFKHIRESLERIERKR